MLGGDGDLFERRALDLVGGVPRGEALHDQEHPLARSIHVRDIHLGRAHGYIICQMIVEVDLGFVVVVSERDVVHVGHVGVQLDDQLVGRAGRAAQICDDQGAELAHAIAEVLELEGVDRIGGEARMACQGVGKPGLGYFRTVCR